METQQLSVLNVRNSAASESRSSSITPADGAATGDQQSAFDEQLNQQIEQGRETSKVENNKENQQHTESETVAGQDSAEQAGSQSGEQLAQQANDLHRPADGIEVVQSGVQNALDLASLQPGTIPSTDAATVAESTLSLPQDGNALPQTVNPLVSTQTPGVVISTDRNQLNATELHAMSQQVSSRQVQVMQQSPAQSHAMNSRGATELNGLVENSGRAAAQLPDTILNQVQRNQSQVMPAGDDLPAELVSLVSQSSRQQKVPQSTQISAGQLTANTALASLMTDAQPLGASTPTTMVTSLSAKVATPQWSQQMTGQIALMLNGGIQQAEIKLNPAHLGPMEIKLAINDDQASINFVTQHAPVRDAIDNALPRLREMLEQQGLNLADVDVSTQSEQQAEGEAESASQNMTEDAVESGEAENSIADNAEGGMTVESGVSLYA